MYQIGVQAAEGFSTFGILVGIVHTIAELVEQSIVVAVYFVGGVDFVEVGRTTQIIVFVHRIDGLGIEARSGFRSDLTERLCFVDRPTGVG